MEIIDAVKKQIIYENNNNNLICDHPQIELESYHEDVYENDKYIIPTGKYVCTKCGKEFTAEEYETFIREQNR